MDKKQNSKHKMHCAVDGILESNQKIVITIPGLNEAHQELKNWISEAMKHLHGQAQTGEDLTEAKQNARFALNARFRKVSSAVVAYATNSKDPKEKVLKEKHYYTDTEINKMKDLDIFTNSYTLYSDALPIADKMEPFASPADVEMLKEEADEFNVLLPGKRTQQSRSSTSTQNLDEALKKADELLKGTIDLLMKPVESIHPDFNKTYKNARIVEDAPYRKRKKDDDSESNAA